MFALTKKRLTLLPGVNYSNLGRLAVPEVKAGDRFHSYGATYEAITDAEYTSPKMVAFKIRRVGTSLKEVRRQVDYRRQHSVDMLYNQLIHRAGNYQVFVSSADQARKKMTPELRKAMDLMIANGDGYIRNCFDTFTNNAILAAYNTSPYEASIRFRANSRMHRSVYRPEPGTPPGEPFSLPEFKHLISESISL